VRMAFLASVVDCFSRRIVGWSMADHLRTERGGRRAFHGDVASPARPGAHPPHRPCLAVALAFTYRLEQVGIAGSMGTVGDAFDSAAAGNLFASLKRELVHRHSSQPGPRPAPLSSSSSMSSTTESPLDQRPSRSRGVRNEVPRGR
jgi:transposase InsO family protein